MPENASLNASGFRMYEWPGGDTDLHREYGATEPSNVISVTASRSVVGIPFQLQAWQMSNVVNLATGQRRAEWRDYSKSTRGRLVKGYKKDGEFPGEFVARMMATEGDEAKLREVRAWLKQTADEPRDIAAVRGSVVHKLIEARCPLKSLSEEVIRWYIDQQWVEEKRKVYPVATDEDVDFVGNCMANYWAMRESVPFVIIAQEPQVWNLKAGYAGSADVLLWFLPPGEKDKQEHWQQQATKQLITVETIAMAGGTLALGDWKTSPAVYCRTPGSLVLTDDLRWVPVGSLQSGDSLWAFTDNRQAIGKKARRWQRSVVTRTGRSSSPLVRLTMKSGQVLDSTPDHRYLARRSAGGRRLTEGGTIWLRADELRVGNFLPRYMDPWTEDTSKEAGWFAGILDGEGWHTPNGSLGFAQNEGPVAERARAFMRQSSIRWTEGPNGLSSCIAFDILGTQGETAAILGRIRPSRLIPKFHPLELQTSRERRDRIIAIEHIDSGEVVNLSTSSETYFSDGYGSHNTGHVVQGTAYMAGSFIGRNGMIDDRLSRLLKATMQGLIIKIRPDGWEVDSFEYRDDVALAFFGQIALARFLLTYEAPTELFSESISGSAPADWRPNE